MTQNRVKHASKEKEVVDSFCFAHFDEKNELAERQAKLYARELTDFTNTLHAQSEVTP